MSLYRQVREAWQSAIPASGEFVVGKAYPVVATVRGVTRRFAVTKHSGAGPFKLTALVNTANGPSFVRYTLGHDASMTREGQVNLWALDASVRGERIAEFKALFTEPQQAFAAEAPQVAETAPQRSDAQLAELWGGMNAEMRASALAAADQALLTPMGRVSRTALMLANSEWRDLMPALKDKAAPYVALNAGRSLDTGPTEEQRPLERDKHGYALVRLYGRPHVITPHDAGVAIRAKADGVTARLADGRTPALFKSEQDALAYVRGWSLDAPEAKLSDRIRRPSPGQEKQRAAPYTRDELDRLYVSNMNDDQLRQAAALFTDGPKAQAVRLQIERRMKGAAGAEVSNSSSVQRSDGAEAKRAAMALIDAVNEEFRQLYRDAVPYVQGDPVTGLHDNAPQDLKDRWEQYQGNREAARKAYIEAYGQSPDGRPIERAPQAAAVVSVADHVIREEDGIGEGGLMAKFRDNIRAIKTVKAIEAEGRRATPEELQHLARYVGWGGMKGVFDPDNKGWSKQHEELRALLTPEEWAAASRSQLDAFYTSTTVVKAMYSALVQVGFTGGVVIDPSVGSGNFIGMMPPGMREQSQFHGVELDRLTSSIAAALYPSAHIAKATGFQDYRAQPGDFDLVIGNPPFGSQALADDRGSAYSGWSIHNYFFAKSIEMLRPGGLMSMVVSHAFLDKLDPQVREWIARRAELVSGVRLPNTAFKGNANTDVTTDILMFRRLDDSMTLGPLERPAWLDTTDVAIKKEGAEEATVHPVNNYFLANPENVLGRHSTAGSMYRADSYTVEPTGDLAEQLSAWVETLPTGLYSAIEREGEKEQGFRNDDIPEHVKEGAFFVREVNGKPMVLLRLPDHRERKVSRLWTPPNERAVERMVGMIEIRELLRQQLRLERSADASDVQIDENRQALNKAYDRFQGKFGYLNDPVNRRIFHDDIESPLVQALEFDYEKAITPAYAEEHGLDPRPARAVKADIFSQRVLFPPGEREVVQTAKDALLHSLNVHGRVDMDYMVQAYGKPKEEILAELGDLVFSDPKRGYVAADEYLSGDVKTKLSEAQEAAKDDPAMQRNVEALQKVIPADKMPSEIHGAIGAMWIPGKVFRDFAREVTGGNVEFFYVRATGQWLVQSKSGLDLTKNNNEFGTTRVGAVDILLTLMNGRAPEVKKLETVDGKERYVTDEAETEAARQAADKIRSHWDTWLWAAEDRAIELASIYNERFNRTVERKYNGDHLTFPGMSRSIEFLGHQKSGVWRGLQSRVLLLDHVVGAGKTFEIIAMLMEAKRMGICQKPLLGVPNHLTLQWRSEFYRLYPGANVLAATPADFEGEARERLFSKIATGNWDAVIIGHSSLKKIALPPGMEAKIIGEQLEEIAGAIEDMKRDRGDRHVMRDMEKIKSNLEAKIKKLTEKAGEKSKVVDMADLGIDAMAIDESHIFKNLAFNTQMQRVSGLGNPAGSGQAFDLFVKTRWLQQEFGESAMLIHATGTPVSNSLAEMFTVQRFMQYSRLKEQGLHVFDAWAKLYGDVQNVYEVAPSGTGYRLSQRFAKFKNLGSLMGEYRSFADVVTLNDLKAQELARGKVFPVPKLEGGRPINVVVPRSRLQEAFFGVPEIARDQAGNIKFEVNLDPLAPLSVVQATDGKFEIHQPGPGGATGRGPRRFETAAEAAYMTALAAITPVMHIDPKSIIGQFENLRELTRSTKGKINALSLTGLANKAGLDYRLINPGARDDPNSKVNRAVGNMMRHWHESTPDKGVQLVFCDLSVPLSAKAKMASKEKRVFVRDGDGELRHTKGTLHTVREYEGFPYYVVAAGRAAARTFSIYDPTTGQLMKEGLDSKKEAHAFVTNFLKSEGGAERWMDLREQSREIDDAERDEYKANKGLDAEGDAADIEFSRADIEGATGVADFSVYDDIKAKLVAQGVPEHEVQFIHDYDTPQAKDTLFKRVNAGDVRFLLGSTPKMGAGTNVQQRIVALHNIDAPYRPSDLEQREGRAIRRGNKLYERDPEGFRMAIYRYATEQTYDTRRWQLLEHKASGIEQLRNYAVGLNEIDDVTTEAANSADMKAASSGNPLILKETQLSNEVKKLRNLERAHRDGQFSLASSLRDHERYLKEVAPELDEALKELVDKRDAAKCLAEYEGKQLNTKEELQEALDDIKAKVGLVSSTLRLTYRGLKFSFKHDPATDWIVMTLPDKDFRQLDAFSRAGVTTRMENFLDSLEEQQAKLAKQIDHAETWACKLRPLIGKPFPDIEALQTAVEEHAKVQRALRKSNSLAAVKPNEAKAFAAAVARQKDMLRKMGFGEAIDELEREERAEPVLAPGAMSKAPGAERTGDYIGQIISIQDGLAVQRVGRDGETVSHRLDDLPDRGAELQVGQLVTLTYADGRATITRDEGGQSLGR